MRSHKILKNPKEYFFYNKENELIRLIEISKKDYFFSWREIIDNSFFTYTSTEKKVQIFKEIKVYPHKCHFNNLITKYGNYLLPVQKGKFLNNGYSKFTKYFSKNNDSIESFTIKNDLIKDLKKE